MNNTQQLERSIFLHCIDLPKPEQVARFLAEACGDNEDIRARVEALLAENQKSGDIFDDRQTNVEEETLAVVEALGQQIGPYKLLEVIGEGGMGTIYMAEQTEPVHRRVALKLIKTGMDTRQVIARFEAERQALALMDHPNIAKVLDAGATESGRPYFVMELVHGVAITDYCDSKKLTNRQRLELFIDVCHAVQHAHQKGIIHRDLKPSNVMVTVVDDRAVVKVIDFGVAKALHHDLTDKSIYTGYGQLIGTPMYMSPEQAQLSSLDVDTRSDIYSLGVLLYELLTGTTPFDIETFKKAGFDEMRRMIREVGPRRPSEQVSTLNAEQISTISDSRGIDQRSLGRALRGDLDWIVMKALDKERMRRFETANALADDIERFLDDEPVVARPPSTVYRLRKFAVRNKVGVGFASLGILVFVGGIVGLFVANRWILAEALKANEALQQKAQALEEKNEALSEAKRADDRRKATHNFVMRRIVESALPTVGGSHDRTVREALIEAAAAVETDLADDPQMAALTMANLGYFLEEIGEYELAAKLLESSIKIHADWLGNDHEETIAVKNLLISPYWRSGQIDKALAVAREVYQLSDKQFGSEDERTVDAIWQLGIALEKTEAYDEAERYLEQVVQWSKDGRYAKLEALALINLGNCSFYRCKYELAETYWNDARDKFESLGSSGFNIVTIDQNLSNVYWETGRRDKSIGTLNTAINRSEDVLGSTHPTTLDLIEVLARRYHVIGDLSASASEFRKLVDRSKEQYGIEDPFSARAMYHLGIALTDLGQPQEALPLLQQALAIQRKKPGELHPHVCETLHQLRETCDALKNRELAIGYLDQVIQVREKIAKKDPGNLANIVWLGGEYCNLANEYSEGLQDSETAVTYLNLAIENLEKAVDAAPTDQAIRFLRNSYWSRSHNFGLLKQWDSALEDMDHAIRLSVSPTDKLHVRLWKARLLAQSGAVDSAVDYVEQILSTAKDPNPNNLFLAARILGLCADQNPQLRFGGEDVVGYETPKTLESSCIDLLEMAEEEGYFETAAHVEEIEEEPDFEAIRDDPRFESLVQQIRAGTKEKTN